MIYKPAEFGQTVAFSLLFQWHRTPTTQETDGFQVKRPGDVSVRCTLLLMLEYQVRAARRLASMPINSPLLRRD